MSFVDAYDFSVDLVQRVLGIAASTYYDWRARRTAPSLRRREDEELLRLIDAIRGAHEFAAGYDPPRVWLALRRRGVRVGAQARGAHHACPRPPGCLPPKTSSNPSDD
jgi:putative transposase